MVGLTGVVVATIAYGPNAWVNLIELDLHDTFFWSSVNLSLTGFLTRMYSRAFTVYHYQTMRLVLVAVAGDRGRCDCVRRARSV